MSIREYAADKGYPIKGKLKRYPDKHRGITDGPYLKYIYVDEVGSEFWISNSGAITIVTPDGGVV